MNTPKSQVYINLGRKDSVFSLLSSYLDIYLEAVKKDANSRYTNGNDIRLVNLGRYA